MTTVEQLIEMIDAVIASHSGTGSRRAAVLIPVVDEVNEPYSYLVAKNAANEGVFLVWSGAGSNTDLTEDVYEAITEEAERAGLADVYHATGKRVGWEPIEQSGFVKFWREAVRGAAKFPHEPDPSLDAVDWLPGTYELVGPKINGNPEHLDRHDLELHGATVLQASVPGGTERVTVTDLLNACRLHGWEGVVWHHRDGRRAKLKVRDYPKAAETTA